MGIFQIFKKRKREDHSEENSGEIRKPSAVICRGNSVLLPNGPI